VPHEFPVRPTGYALFHTGPRKTEEVLMLIATVVAVAILILPIAYVIFRKFTVTRQEIEFATPQNGVSAIYLDIKEDTVRSLHIVFEDGSVAEIGQLRAA
jgi:hypothetical protein